MRDLVTSRLALRGFSAADAPAVELLVGEADLARMVGHIPHPYPPGGAVAWMEHTRPAIAAGTLAQFALVERERGALVGCLSLKRESVAGVDAELAYWVGKPFWGCGYATEAGFAAIDEVCSGHWRSASVWAGVLESNARSRRVLEKLGLQADGMYSATRPGRSERVTLLRFRRRLSGQGES